MTRHNDWLSDPEIRRVFEQELLFGEVTDTLGALIESVGISQRELAKRLGVTEARVSQVLGGGENLTLRTVADIGWALGVRFELDAAEMENRAGSPAAEDPPAPAWIVNLREHQPSVSFQPAEVTVSKAIDAVQLKEALLAAMHDCAQAIAHSERAVGDRPDEHTEYVDPLLHEGFSTECEEHNLALAA